MLELCKRHAMTEMGENVLLIESFPALAQREEIHVMVTGQRLEQVERALVGAAIHRIRNVGINNKQTHSQLN